MYYNTNVIYLLNILQHICVMDELQNYACYRTEPVSLSSCITLYCLMTTLTKRNKNELK